jgi:hypothetical protein
MQSYSPSRSVRGVLCLLPALCVFAGTGALQPDVKSGATTPIAMIEGRSVQWEELGPLLSEAAGAVVLEELVLHDQLKAECSRVGIAVSDADIESERRLYTETLVTAAGVQADQAESLLREVRRTRGLGDLRFRQLLERNAMLRGVARSRGMVTITEEDITLAHRIKWGPQRKVRLILTTGERDALGVVRRLREVDAPPAPGEAPASTTPEKFAQVAADASIDVASRSRGGLVGWVRTEDPAYPVAIRRALDVLRPGQISDPISVEQGYAVVMVEDIREQSMPSLSSVKGDLEREVRQVRERAAMDRIAREFIDAARVTVFERSLGATWEARTAPR